MIVMNLKVLNFSSHIETVVQYIFFFLKQGSG